MNNLTEVAPAFVEMAHHIVWCSAATVDAQGRPRSRILHPIWQWDGRELIGWIATSPTPTKRAHLEASPYISLNYWSPTQDTCVAECRVSWAFDDETRAEVWNLFANGPEPVGYDPTLIAEVNTAVEKGALDEEKTVDVKGNIEKAVIQAKKSEPDKKSILDRLEEAKSLLAGVAAAGGMITALAQAAEAVRNFF